MFKIFFGVGVLSFVSVACDYALDAEEQKKVELALEESTRNINRLFSEVAGGYEKLVRSLNDFEFRNKATDYDNGGTGKSIDLETPRLEARRISDSLFLNTFGGTAWNYPVKRWAASE